MMDIVVSKRLAQLYDDGEPAVLCIVVEEAGSTPRSVGSSMIVLPGGKIVGTIGGGVTEHRVMQKAGELLAKGSGSMLYRETLTNEEAAQEGRPAAGRWASTWRS